MMLSTYSQDQSSQDEVNRSMASTPTYTTDVARWQAVVGRDPAADGQFLYGVTSTKIYCRPTCPSRRPKRENTVFFEDVSEAEAAGYRACKRCHPKDISRVQQIVAQVQQLIEEGETEPSLADLADAVGLSPSHLQRTFKQATGISPKQYAIARREEKLKQHLKTGKQVTTAMYDAGYGSSHALYNTAQANLGMKPTKYQQGGKGEHITYGLFDCPLGRMLIAATQAGVVVLWFGEDDALVADLMREFPAAEHVRDEQMLKAYASQIVAYLEGDKRKLELPLRPQASEFQARVWAALQAIPYGQTRSYKDIAEAIGEPTAVRAVARACATNPIALAIPCHRVVRSSGALSGYRWGLDRKQALLDQEKGTALF